MIQQLRCGDIMIYFEPILAEWKVQSGNEHCVRQTHRLTKNFDAKSLVYCGNAGTFTFVCKTQIFSSQ